MFPAMIRAVRKVRPKVVLVENVRGLLRKSFATYFGYIKLQIEHPELTAQPEEDWIGHLARLEQHHTSGHSDGLSYNVVFKLANGANYGVPQKRERVFIVGFRSDLNIQWSFPRETHSFDSLLHDQWISGEYWERHRVPNTRIPDPPAAHTARIDRLRNRLFEISEQPWVTVRDATSDLPDPENGLLHEIPNHRLVSGARSYKGHTGSTLDHPAKTLKAGDHGVPGGENMLLKPSGEVRYFTARESARLQTFPDHYVFPGSWSETMRQLGNAVPVELGRVMADSIAKQL
jgi:DNA (cytosine-5)-methyltransferase 1